MDYDPETLRQWDREHVWHPFTQMQGFREENPLIISRGEGVYLYDLQGNRYLDGVSSLWANLHGHRRRELDQALEAQLSQLAHSTLLGIAHPPAILLARRLAELAPPGLNKVFFSDNGSTAVEAALKMAFQSWRNRGQTRKQRFLKLSGAYHGDTLGAVSVGGIPLFHEIYQPLLFDTLEAPAPYCYRCEHREDCREQCLARLEELVAAHHQELAAVIVEPVMQGAAGMIAQPPGYLAKVREVTRRHDVLLIADEVAVGFGRTGRMFACEHAGVKPDILCLSKGITSGYLPLGATMTTEAIYNAFYADHDRRRTFHHGHTYTANPLSCAAALESLRIFEDEDTLSRVRAIMPVFHAGLEKFRSLAMVGDVRYLGLIGAMELVGEKRTKLSLKPGPMRRITTRIYNEGLRRNLILRPLGGIIYLFLPLCVKPKELDYILSSTYESIIKVDTADMV